MSTITLDIESTIDALQERCDDLATLVQDMTAIIAAKCEQERTLSEQIAQAIGPLWTELDTSDMDLQELVDGLVGMVNGQAIRIETMSAEAEDAPGVFLVLNADGRITGPVHDTEKKARDWAELGAQMREGKAFTIARRIAHCNTRIAIDWKEG